MSEKGIRDARTLGVPKMLLLGFQHMFAMFGATVLVPALTGLSVSATLLFAGLGTLLFHLITKRKVPAFLGSSFAFLGGYAAVAALFEGSNVNWIPYAGVGVACAGLVYLVLALLFKIFGASKVMRFFPPIVTGPIIICIGMTLANSAINNCQNNWWIALLAIAIVVVCNIWGKGMIKITPILLGVVGSYLIAVVLMLIFGVETPVVTGQDAAGADIIQNYITIGGNSSAILFSADALEAVKNAKWIGLPVNFMKDTVIGLFAKAETVLEDGTVQMVSTFNPTLLISSIFIMVPISLATVIEHIGDMCAISSTVGENYVAEPGLHRSLMGDGVATSLAALFGAPANTTYGENTGVLALTKVYDPKVVRIAAFLAILFSFCPKFAALVSCMPAATIGGVSLILYGMISAVGVRNVVENKVDFTKSRNVIIAALEMSLALGITFSAKGALVLGPISLSGLAVAALVGIILNAVLPGNDYKFGKDEQGDKSVNFKV